MEALYILNEYFPKGPIILGERISRSVMPDSLCPIDCIIHGISRQEYWSGLPFHTPGDLPHPGTEPGSTYIASGFCTNKPEKSKCSGKSTPVIYINSDSLITVFSSQRPKV